jgi:hypothetical protein
VLLGEVVAGEAQRLLLRLGADDVAATGRRVDLAAVDDLGHEAHSNGGWRGVSITGGGV